MRLTAFFVRNPSFTILFFLMLTVVSVVSLVGMPRAEDPEILSPDFPIVVLYPGTTPQDMEELVVKPIEKKIGELEDIRKINTTINNGVAVIYAEYRYDSDRDDKYQELVREMNAIRDELPADLMSLEVRKVSPSDVNILQIALVSDNASDITLRKLAEQLKTELETVPSLKKVAYHGVPDQQVRVDIDLDRLARLGIPLNYVLASIAGEAANIPAGSLRAGTKSYNVKTSGKYADLEEIENTVVFSGGGKVVRLRDVATVGARASERKHITRHNSHRAALVTAAMKTGGNISQTNASYLPILDTFERKLPANVAMVRAFDQADNVHRRLSGLGLDFMIAIGLVFFTLIPLGWRAASIVMMAIPLSLGLGIVSLDLLGFSLNQLSIVGFVVALGLLVDDSIVVVENIERWLREGHTRKEAAIRATGQITLAVIGTTATLAIAFMPLAFLPGGSGDFIRSLPVAVISAVLASLLVSLTVIPYLSGVILKSHADPAGNIFLRGLKKLISASYTRLLEWALRHPWKTLTAAMFLFICSLGVFGIIGFKLFPSSEKPQFLVNVNMPLQSNLEATDAMTRLIERDILQVPEVEHVTANVGKGNPRIYYNEIPANDKSDYAQLFVQLKNEVNARDKKRIIENLRMRFSSIAGAKIEVKDFEQGPPVDAPVSIRIIGDNLDTLRALADRVEDTLRRVPGTIYVGNDLDVMKSDLRVRIHTEKARAMGIQTADIDRTIRLAVSGIPIARYTDAEGEDYDIVVGTAQRGYATLASLDGIFVNNAQGTPIPLSQVATIGFETSPPVIKHLDRQRYAVVKSFMAPGTLAEDINQAFLVRMEGFPMPAGYRFELAGEREQQQEAFGGGFNKIVIATIFLFIMVLVLEFRTLKSTLIVLSVIPLGVIGGVGMLWATGNPMSFVAIIGFIALAGVEVKNSILLVDFTNQLRRDGMGLEDAIREAGELRFLPIVLTSLTAIGGLIPIALNTNPLVSPLAIVLIGGLISSTLLSRIVTPVVYKLIPPRV
ncbi:MAG: efflux RND transporter permease subunit [Chitinophagaceae bacterium]|jgi:multidrug efflux pump subunit AcrB